MTETYRIERLSSASPETDYTRRLADVASRIRLPVPTWLILIREYRTEGLFILQIEEPQGIDNVTGGPMAWRSRRWLLSEHMTQGEIVQTAFKACMTAIEHEFRETFLFDGHSVFDPHYDIAKLATFRADPESIKERH